MKEGAEPTRKADKKMKETEMLAPFERPELRMPEESPEVGHVPFLPELGEVDAFIKKQEEITEKRKRKRGPDRIHR